MGLRFATLLLEVGGGLQSLIVALPEIFLFFSSLSICKKCPKLAQVIEKQMKQYPENATIEDRSLSLAPWEER